MVDDMWTVRRDSVGARSGSESVPGFSGSIAPVRRVGHLGTSGARGRPACRRCAGAPLPARPRQAGEEAQADRPDGVVRVRVEQADRLPRPERQPAVDDRHGQRRRGEQRQDVVGAVTGANRADGGSGSSRGRSRSSAAIRSVVGAGADLDDHEPGRRMRARRPTAARRVGGDLGEEARAAAVRSVSPRPDPVRTVSSRRVYGKMLRRASRSRPRPPRAGADS